MTQDLTLVPYGVFCIEHNKLLRTGVCQRALLDEQAHDGEEAVEGQFDFGERVDERTVSQRRYDAYPAVGEQLSAIVDLAKAVKAAGVDVPASVDDWLTTVDAVKAAHPKDTE